MGKIINPYPRFLTFQHIYIWVSSFPTPVPSFYVFKWQLRFICYLTSAASLSWIFFTQAQSVDVTFRHLDLTDPSSESVLSEHLSTFGKKKFDVVFCFSVTMWVHLNHGDDGLVDFLRRLSKFGKYLVRLPNFLCFSRPLLANGEPSALGGINGSGK